MIAETYPTYVNVGLTGFMAVAAIAIVLIALAIWRDRS